MVRLSIEATSSFILTAPFTFLISMLLYLNVLIEVFNKKSILSGINVGSVVAGAASVFAASAAGAASLVGTMFIN